MTSLHLTADRLASHSVPSHGEHWLGRSWTTLSTWIARSRERHQLTELDEHMLKDIGMTRADVVVESGKPFWAR